jgi:hypothetical protein
MLKYLRMENWEQDLCEHATPLIHISSEVMQSQKATSQGSPIMAFDIYRSKTGLGVKKKSQMQSRP